MDSREDSREASNSLYHSQTKESAIRSSQGYLAMGISSSLIKGVAIIGGGRMKSLYLPHPLAAASMAASQSQGSCQWRRDYSRCRMLCTLQAI